MSLSAMLLALSAPAQAAGETERDEWAAEPDPGGDPFAIRDPAAGKAVIRPCASGEFAPLFRLPCGSGEAASCSSEYRG
jgi:hypothetical protein